MCVSSGHDSTSQGTSLSSVLFSSISSYSVLHSYYYASTPLSNLFFYCFLSTFSFSCSLQNVERSSSIYLLISQHSEPQEQIFQLADFSSLVIITLRNIKESLLFFIRRQNKKRTANILKLQGDKKGEARTYTNIKIAQDLFTYSLQNCQSESSWRNHI